MMMFVEILFKKSVYDIFWACFFGTWGFRLLQVTSLAIPVTKTYILAANQFENK